MGQLIDGRVISRPIAGTRPRGTTEADDRRLGDELSEHPKELAEHVILVDLARNDVGGVVRFGTERVDELMTLERYSHVMHLTSQVSGELVDGKGPIDVLRATLPAGTVSGAPKVRAMEIIDELEPTRRGPYAGVVGYFDFSGNLDTAIAIRTMFVAPDGRASVEAGAGIVADRGPPVEDDAVILDTDAGFGDAVRTRLERFKLRIKADIEPLAWRCVAVRGPSAHSFAIGLDADWPGLPGVDIVGEGPELPEGVRVCDMQAYDAVRIEAGVPAMGREIDERTIPAETGVVDRAVSFTKGCFTGQELVARIDSRGGNVPRHPRGVVVGTNVVPTVGATISANGKEDGRRPTRARRCPTSARCSWPASPGARRPRSTIHPARPTSRASSWRRRAPFPARPCTSRGWWTTAWSPSTWPPTPTGPFTSTTSKAAATGCGHGGPRTWR